MERDEQINRRRGVAVIAVHGVADQVPGATARKLAELLVAAPPGNAVYRVDGADEITLRVEPLAPTPQVCEAARRDADVCQPATPSGPRPILKAMAQSLRSDLHRPDWTVDKQMPMSEAPPPADEPNPGVELTDFLLFKAVRNKTPTVAYDTTRLRLLRSQPGHAAEQPVDVYEMYWADLSRLAPGVPRVLSELFTLLFRVSQLGRDAVAASARQFTTPELHARSWRWLSALQTALDWAFSKGLALLTLQLVMAALIFVPVGLVASRVDFASSLRGVLLVAVPSVSALWFLYRFEKSWRSWLTAAVAFAVLCALLVVLDPHWVAGITWLVLLSVAYDLVMRICDERFPMTRFVGWIMWPAVMLVVVGSAALLPSMAIPGMEAERGLRIFTFGALRAVEWILVTTILWWGFAGVLLFAWMLVGQVCSRTNGFEGRATVATGRLGLFASMSLFVVLVMASWAALTTLFDLSVANMNYLPLFFTDPGNAVTTATAFLDLRYRNSTETFSIIAVLLVLLGGYLVIGFFPSLLAEMKLLRSQPARLGRWLTIAYRHLDTSVAVLVVIGVLCATVVGVTLNSRWFGLSLLSEVNARFEFIPMLSQDFLKPLIWTAASATVALTLLGGFLSRYVPWLRAPLDMALDIDSHFREFPRRGIPRALIFSRFAALLRQVADQGYERVVIVAHSQGTVITTELLRYLQYRAGQPAGHDGEAGRLWRDLGPELRLLTAGSPLRQLYVARFPTLYRWVLHDETGVVTGPTAQAVGVQRWVNAFSTGDYVGRWLWTRGPLAGDASDAAIDELRAPQDVYIAEPAPPDLADQLATRQQIDVCLGAGAHTHYFDDDQPVVASLVDQLIVTPFDAVAMESASGVGVHAAVL